MSYYDQLKSYEIQNFIKQFGYRIILQEMFEILYCDNKPKEEELKMKIKEALDCCKSNR